MKSAQTMLSLARTASALGVAAIASALTIGPTGCATEPRLNPPAALIAPYATDADALWAVTPIRNESGTSAADELRLADAVAAAAAQTRGVRCLPLNRTIQAMRALDMPEVNTPAQALALADAMGVDAILVGSATAYDPYDPPTIGLSIALFARTNMFIDATPAGDFDPVAFSASPTDAAGMPGSTFGSSPHSTAAVHLDARNHQTLMELKRFAEGRHDPAAALGWRSYTASMDLYTDFAAHQAVGALLREEWLRLATASRGRATDR